MLSFDELIDVLGEAIGRDLRFVDPGKAVVAAGLDSIDIMTIFLSLSDLCPEFRLPSEVEYSASNLTFGELYHFYAAAAERSQSG